MLLLLMLRVAVAVAAFEASFHDMQQIGSSNYTHFWMPTPLVRATKLSNSSLILHVGLCGDGTKCPPPGHPQPTSSFFTKPSIGPGPWNSLTTHLPTNTAIRLNNTASRGFGGILLDSGGDNTTARALYQDWIVDADGTIILLTPGKAVAAPVTGMPPMLLIAYFMDSPAAVLKTVAGGEEVLTQFYGYMKGKTDGCTNSVGAPRKCYSIVTLASSDQGASWQYRSAINWDATRMPTDVEGPCEPSLVVLPDNKTLLSVFRVNDGRGSHLWQTASTDHGRSWQPASETNAWSVFPQLRSLSNGALVLTAGRPGIGLWLADGRADAAASASASARGGPGPPPLAWKFYNLAREHNALMGSGADPDLLYPAGDVNVINSTSKVPIPALTKAYTGLETIGCDNYGNCTLVVSYDRLANGNAGPDPPPTPHGSADAAFTMRVTVHI
jgi:hypothetical protein